MLPSLGSFRSLECPFYNGGEGQCSRPYCHYRHVKRDPNAPPEPDEDILGLVPAVEPIQTDDEGKSRASTEPVVKSRASMYKAIVEAAPTYDPTPISQLKSSHIPIPYTPTIPTRSSVVKKSKPSSEYVPHYVGNSRPSYPPYCPSSISSLNCQVQNAPLNDPLKNPLYEIYGPEGAQYSPNDVDPVGTSYSYAPPKSASYAPYSPEYVSSGLSYKPQLSPQGAQFSDDDDNVDLAAETAAQSNGNSSGEASLIDLDLSGLDNLELELEENNEENCSNLSKSGKLTEPSNKTSKSQDANNLEVHRDKNKSSKNTEHQKAEKRRSSSSTNSSSDIKRHKPSSSSVEKNGHKEKAPSSSSSSSSSLKKSSSSSSHTKKSSSHSSSKSKTSSSKSSKSVESSKSSKTSDSSKSSKISSGSESKKVHSEHQSKSGSSHSSSKHKTKHIEKSSSKSKERDKRHEKEKHSMEKKHSKRSSDQVSETKEGKDLDREKLEEEIRMMELELDASLEDEDMIEQQCYEMFSEYSETMQNQTGMSKNEDQRVSVHEEPISSAPSKKRIAHQASHSSTQPTPKPATTLAKKCSPYQVMRDRWEMLKKEKMQALEAKSSLAIAPPTVPRAPAPTPYSSTNTPCASLASSVTGKKKIASVPNVAMLLKPKPQPPSHPPASSISQSGTPANRFYNKESQRVDEFGRLVKVRVAHAPNMDAPVMKKPVVNPSDCRKFKVATRQANVNKLYQAYLNAGFGDASHDMALESEKSSTQGTESLGVYSHRIIQILKDLRACAETSQSGPKMDGMSGIPNRVVSHSAMLAGKLGAKVSWSIQPAKKETETKSYASLYEQLQCYILTKEQLEENGFPMPNKEKGLASIKPSSYRVIQQPTNPLERICVRCLKRYFITKRGEQVKEEECFYHWGRKLTTRRFREAETRYTCCDSTGSGCSVSPYHVFEQDWEKSSGFMSTLSKPWMDADPGVYALDCEMCYTTAGLELTRVTVIKEDLSVAYEALVKPAHKILDYNTRYSGITEEDLDGVQTTILQVQATLLGMFCDKTILIGHSLESDMKALKLIHPTVVDTSVVFPHKMGPPQKRALRNLAADYLKKIIQNDVGGHDSKEDAVAALELMLWKLKEDEKTR